MNRPTGFALLLAFFAAAVAGRAPRLLGAEGDDAAALRRIESEWNEALKAHDAGWIERHFAEDATDVGSADGVLRGKADDIAAMKADKTVYESTELLNLRVRVDGRAAIVTGVNHLRGRNEGGEPFDVRLAFTDTYVKRGDRWLVWATQHTRVH